MAGGKIAGSWTRTLRVPLEWLEGPDTLCFGYGWVLGDQMGSNFGSEKLVDISRTIEAPKDAVFKAWSTPEALTRWFAPAGCDLLVKSMDFRPGGVLHACVLNPVKDCWTRSEYLEIVPGEKISFTMGIADEAGLPQDALAAGMDPAWPSVTTVVVTFTETNGRTTMRLQQTVSEELAKKTGAYPSWLSMFDRLEQEVSAVLA